MQELKTYFIDSNVFLRFLVQDDAKAFESCVAFFKKIEQGRVKIVISPLVFAEIVWVLKSYYKFKKEKIIQALRAILLLKNLSVQDKSDPLKAIELFENNAIKFIDCLIASDKNLQTQQYALISYDRDFDALGVIREEPS